MIDVPTTPRKPLSPTKRLAIFELRKGMCCVCNHKIRDGEGWIDEHLLALGLGGSNDDGNRYIAHVKCAAIKTREEDMPRIVKAKAQKRASLGLKNPNRRRIPHRKAPVKVRDKLDLPKRVRDVFGRSMP